MDHISTYISNIPICTDLQSFLWLLFLCLILSSLAVKVTKFAECHYFWAISCFVNFKITYFYCTSTYVILIDLMAFSLLQSLFSNHLILKYKIGSANQFIKSGLGLLGYKCYRYCWKWVCWLFSFCCYNFKISSLHNCSSL